MMSPSTRREWIEIAPDFCFIPLLLSPSTRREWIEINYHDLDEMLPMSPSTRREWIEITAVFIAFQTVVVSLHTEGVD